MSSRNPALAPILIAQAGLGRIEADERVAFGLFCAEKLLDAGVTSRELVKGLGLFTAPLDALAKYSPDQPRVPAGNPDGGEWTSEDGSRAYAADANDTDSSPLKPFQVADSDQFATDAPIQMASNDDPLVPGGVVETPSSDVDPLDPKGLNTAPTPQEQQRIADTVNRIQKGDVKGLLPRRYGNLPESTTGAILPPSATGYTSYTVPTDAEGKGIARIVIDNATGAMYYTANHYKSFIPLVTAPPSR